MSPLDRGEAGASASRRYQRLHDQRETRACERFGRFSGLYLALRGEPQSTRAWATGGSGERKLAAYLEGLNNDTSLIVLHDRRIPRSRANVDHVAITPRGVFIIDAKKYTGKVRKVDRGGWFSTDLRLYVGRRDCTKLVRGMSRQVDAVRQALGAAIIQEFAVPVTPILCFVDGEWSLFARPFQLGEVWVEWPRSLGERLSADGPLAAEQVRTLAEKVAAKLSSA